VRRDITWPDGGMVRVLSRVSFRRPNLFAVEYAGPATQRAVYDHDVFSLFDDGAALGMEGFAVRTPDASNRLVRLEVYADGELTELVSQTDFSAHEEVAPGLWIARLRKSERIVDGGRVRTTTRVGNIVVNREIADEVFQISDGAEIGNYELPVVKNEVEDKGGGISSTLMAPARGFVWLYRSQISPAIGDKCRLVPSCSEYFMQASRKHGLLSIPMIADRFIREGTVMSKRANPVVLPDGRELWADPVEDNDWWFAK